MTTRVGHLPGEKWAFDDAVTKCFDDMLERSIPQYRTMRELVTRLALDFLRPGDHLLDLGCSRGEAMAPIVFATKEKECHFTGLEISEPMVAAARERFSSRSDVEIRPHDLRAGVSGFRQQRVILSVLTVQFTPIEHRQRILRDVFDYLEPGGVFIFVEKILGNTSEINELMVAEYLAMKARNGYSQEEIDRKRAALEGVLVPVTAKWNEDLLEHAGFREVDCFWRWMNFAGWIGVKK